MESHMWIVSLSGRGIQHVSSEDLQGMSRFYIVPPGADVLLQENKNKVGCNNIKEEKKSVLVMQRQGRRILADCSNVKETKNPDAVKGSYVK
eukprot:8033666-Ditylum_brightwellii.AAC.1